MIKNNLPSVMSVLEHQELTPSDFVIKSDFDWLVACDFDVFTARYQRGQWRLKVGHYIGVVLLPSGISLEILPKTTQQLDSPNINDSRRWVCQMLSDLSQNNVTPKQKALGQFSPNLANNNDSPPLIDWLMAHFFALLKQYSPSSTYQANIQSQAMLQGKLVIKEQLKQPPTGKLVCEIDQRNQNLISNRLIKSALLLFSRQFYGALQAWQPILPLSRQEQRQLDISYQQARSEIKAQAKGWQSQQNAFNCLEFAYWLLRQQANLQSGGAVLTQSPSVPKLCLFINMNQAFEHWAGLCIASDFFKKGNYHAVFQPRDVWLSANDGAAYLSIQPDLLIYEKVNNQPLNCSHVIDMKWKSGSASIRANDAYQLTSYAQAYGAKHIWLVYPVTDNQAMPIRLQQNLLPLAANRLEITDQNAAAFWLMPFNVTIRTLIERRK